MIKRLALLLSLLGALGLGVTAYLHAQEAVTLATPVVKPSTSSCHLSYMNLDVDNARVMAVLACNNGDAIQKIYDSTTTPSGATLLHSINTANFTTNSFIKAVYTRLIADGVLTGTISGTAQ